MPFSKSKMESELPSYTAPNSPTVETKEKQPTPSCDKHTTPTPYLDAHLTQPTTIARIQALSAALNNIVDDSHCSRCAAEDAVQALTAYIGDLKAAKKSGEWTSAEKKGFKNEMKGLGREIKRDVKSAWRGKGVKV